MVVRHPSEPYEAYLSVYSPEGLFIERKHLGEIPANRRRFFDISSITQKVVPDLDHLTVVHRIPSRLLSQVSSVEEQLELPAEPDYSMFRSLIEYSFPQGGNGSVIYETPPLLNMGTRGPKSSNTLTFTCQTVLSELVNTYVVLIHYSMNPLYSQIADYHFTLHSLSGERVLSDHVTIGPFGIKLLDMAQIIPRQWVEKEKDPHGHLSPFTFVGYSEDAALQVLLLNAAPTLGAVSVEHTHPPQAYLFPKDPAYQRKIKTDAQMAWKSILSGGRSK
jgi:hypothetical protein